MRVCVVGAGVMGTRIARSLIDRGDLVTVVDRDEERAADVAASIGAIAGLEETGPDDVDADAVVVAVTGPPASRSVAIGDTGMMQRVPTGAIYVDCTTSDPGTVKELAIAAGERDLHFIDAPLSGLPPDATAIVGATDPSIRAATELLQAFCSRIHHVGEAGAGTIVKLMNQFLAFANFLSACDAFEIARGHGVSPGKALEALASSFGDSQALRAYGTYVIGDDLDGTSGSLDIVRKDVKLVVDTFDQLGLRSEAAQRLQRLFDEAHERDWDDRGFAAVSLLVPDDLRSMTSPEAPA